MTLDRREMLRLGAMGAAGAILSTAAGSTVLQLVPGPQGLDPLAPLPAAPQRAPARFAQAPSAPAGIDPQLFARAKAALDLHGIWARDSIGIADFSQPSSEPRFHVVDLANGTAQSHLVAMAAAPIPITRAMSSVSRTTSAPTRRRTGPTSPPIITTASTGSR